jgi:succinate-semialdehyde dehydrogenase/glutarate-semialdehyde dehydrogenase
MLISGEWTAAANAAAFAVVSPVTAEIVGRVPAADVQDTRCAIAAAKDAFPPWSHTPAHERAAVLDRAAAALLERREPVAALAAIEQGKPVREARGEVAYAAGFLSFFAEEIRRRGGEAALPDRASGKRLRTLGVPVGVAGLITIWNFPLAGVTRPLAAALAAGCTAVVKPAEQTPLCAIAIFEALQAAGLPPGVANLVTTDEPAAVGAELARHEAVRKLSFTGSYAVGAELMRAAAPGMKRLTLELGGHAPLLVFADADLDAAARGALASKFRNGGQTCVAVNRILVEAPVLEPFTERFVALVRELRLGDPRDEHVDVGPLIDAEAMARVERHVADACARGATVLCGGARHTDPSLPHARLFAPTVIANALPEMTVMREETFGPVAPIAAFATEDEAVRAANNLPWGLAAFAYTRDRGRAERLAWDLDFGIVGINDTLPGAPHVPFGGVKRSGLGREGGRAGLEEFLEQRLVSEGP